MAKQNEQPNVLVEDIDHTIHNVAFDYLVLSVYGNSSLSRSPTKFGFVGTTIIIINIKSALIKTHVKLIKKGNFLWLEFFFAKAKYDYDKGNSDYTIKLFIATKVTIVPPFNLHVKLFFHVATFCNNDHCICCHWCVWWNQWQIWTLGCWWDLPKRH